MKRIHLSILLGLLFLVPAAARQLTPDEALQRATQSRVARSRSLATARMELVHTQSVGFTRCLYVMNRPASQGYMVLSADDCAPAVLGYTSQGSFDPAHVPDNLAWFLDRYTQQIVNATRQNSRVVSRAPEQGEYIPTLIEARWNQGEPYNRLCTDFDALPDPTPTGCVATAIAQIMRQYRWPERGTGSHQYTTTCEIDGKEHTAKPQANFDVAYDWDNMLFDYHQGYTRAQGDAVALLMRHVGVACDMGYGPTGSGAGVDNPIRALRTYFGYDKNMVMHTLSTHTDESFAQVMLDELRAGRALYASGNGHAFLCDGYDGEGFFHWNWGWGGSGDGYYLLAGDEAVNGFRDGLCCISGIQPDQGGMAPTVMRIDNYTLDRNRITDYSQEVKLDGFLHNGSQKKVKVLYAAHFIGDNGSYVVPSFYTDIDHGYGFTSYSFRCPTVPNGTYKVYAAYRDMETGQWHFPSCNPEGGIPTITIDVPERHIYTAADLVALREDVANGIHGTAIFHADIDLSEECSASIGSWKPIGSASKPFCGRIEGRGHVISNLFIRTSSDFQGLVGAIRDAACIEGLTLDATCNVRGGGYVGGIAGGTTGSAFVTIRNCGNEGVVYAQRVNGAGIIGCSVNGEGKIVIENCYNAGRITGPKENAAICAWTGEWGVVDNCYNIATVGGNDGSRSFVRQGSNGQIYDCYQLSTVYPRQRNVTQVAKAAVTDGELAWLMNQTEPQVCWTQSLDTVAGADAYPTLRQSQPHVYALDNGTYGNVPDDLMQIADADDYTRALAGVCSEVHYERHFAQASVWETLFVPFTSTAAQWGEQVSLARIDGVHQYDDNGDGLPDRTELEAVSLQPTDSVCAATPYLVMSHQPCTLSLRLYDAWMAGSAETQAPWSANASTYFYLQGTFAATTTGHGDYTLQGHTLVPNPAATVLGQRWYLHTQWRQGISPAPQRIALRVDGSTATGLIGIEAEQEDTAEYDLLGRPAQRGTSGLHIRQGRKVLTRP